MLHWVWHFRVLQVAEFFTLFIFFFLSLTHTHRRAHSMVTHWPCALWLPQAPECCQPKPRIKLWIKHIPHIPAGINTCLYKAQNNTDSGAWAVYESPTSYFTVALFYCSALRNFPRIVLKTKVCLKFNIKYKRRFSQFHCWRISAQSSYVS